MRLPQYDPRKADLTFSDGRQCDHDCPNRAKWRVECGRSSVLRVCSAHLPHAHAEAVKRGEVLRVDGLARGAVDLALDLIKVELDGARDGNQADRVRKLRIEAESLGIAEAVAEEYRRRTLACRPLVRWEDL